MKPIPYVHILFDIGGGLVTDENGFFKINETKTIKELKFSVLAYEEKVIKHRATKNLQIFLKTKTYQLDEISVSPG